MYGMNVNARKEAHWYGFGLGSSVKCHFTTIWFDRLHGQKYACFEAPADDFKQN